MYILSLEPIATYKGWKVFIEEAHGGFFRVRIYKTDTEHVDVPLLLDYKDASKLSHDIKALKIVDEVPFDTFVLIITGAASVAMKYNL